MVLEADQSVIPCFELGSSAISLFAAGTSGKEELQTTGESQIPFHSGEGIRYTAKKPNGELLKDYWATFLTQQDEPTLFVNGTNNPGSRAKLQNSPDTLPVRTIHFTESFSFHDILFANLGSEKLTGLSVRLTGPDGTGEAQ